MRLITYPVTYETPSKIKLFHPRPNCSKSIFFLFYGPAECAERSAALVVDMARRVGPKAQKSECQSQSADHKPPSYLPPAHLRIPPGHPKPTVQLILWFCKNNSQCRAGSKKLIPHRHWCEYASKMQASNCFFYAFHVSTHFLHHIFSKLLFLLERGQHFCKTTSNDFNQKFHFFDPQTASIRAFFVI